jgi:hypothetical protein
MTAAKWSKADNSKLAELFPKGTCNHGISTKDLSAKYIYKVIKDHFPDREFKNFSVLFRCKARAWNLNLSQTLQGQQWFQLPCLYFVSLMYILIVSEGEKGTNKADEGDEGENQDVDDEDSIEESERGEGTETPKKKAPTVDDLEEELSTMKIHKPSASSSGPYNMSFRSPYIQYTNIEDERRHVCTDFLVPGWKKESFHPKVEGMDLVLGVAMPEVFFNENHIALSNAHDMDFNKNTNKATAFMEVTGKIVSDLEDGEEIVADPQRVKLPFAVEDEIADREMQAFENHDAIEIADSLGWFGDKPHP